MATRPIIWSFFICCCGGDQNWKLFAKCKVQKNNRTQGSSTLRDKTRPSKQRPLPASLPTLLIRPKRAGCAPLPLWLMLSDDTHTHWHTGPFFTRQSPEQICRRVSENRRTGSEHLAPGIIRFHRISATPQRFSLIMANFQGPMAPTYVFDCKVDVYFKLITSGIELKVSLFGVSG